MNLKQYLAAADKDARADLAAKCGATVGHLQNCAYGLRIPSAELSVAIERETGGVVTRKELHPESWPRIWPELVKSKFAKAA